MNNDDYDNDLENRTDYPYFLGDWNPDFDEGDQEPGLDPDAPMD